VRNIYFLLELNTFSFDGTVVPYISEQQVAISQQHTLQKS